MVGAAWLAVAAVVGVLIGRMIRERDGQVPRVPEPPATGAEAHSPPHRVHGRSRQHRS